MVRDRLMDSRQFVGSFESSGCVATTRGSRGLIRVSVLNVAGEWSIIMNWTEELLGIPH